MDLGRAIMIASAMHGGQKDFHGRPYILHPLAVMNRVLNRGQDYAIVAVMHDVLEDTPYTADDMQTAGFAPQHITAVQALTFPDGLSTESYLDRIKNVVAFNEIASVVKMADLEENMLAKRIKDVSPRAIARMEKYMHAYHFLKHVEI